MNVLLPIGIELPDSVFAKPQSSGAGGQDVATLVRRSLDEPIDFPPVAEFIFPGDTVAIVLLPDVPEPLAVLKAIVDSLLTSNVEPTDISIVVTQETSEIIKEFGGDAVNDLFSKTDFQVHDPSDKDSLSYLAINREGEQIFVNRTLFDADVLLPVSCLDSQNGIDSVHPEFSSVETLERFASDENSPESNALEISMTNQHLGVFFAINIVGGPGGQVSQVWAGEKAATNAKAREEAVGIWAVNRQDETQLVVATIETEPDHQTWQQFCDALIAAYDVCEQDAQILLHTELSRKPSKELRQVCQMLFETDEEQVFRRLNKLDSQMKRVYSILQERQVFLKSRMSESVIEELGIGFIGSESELERVVGRAKTGVLIRDAHKCRISS